MFQSSIGLLLSWAALCFMAHILLRLSEGTTLAALKTLSRKIIRLKNIESEDVCGHEMRRDA